MASLKSPITKTASIKPPPRQQRVARRRADIERDLEEACKHNWYNLAKNLIRKEGAGQGRGGSSGLAKPLALASQTGATATISQLIELGCDVRAIADPHDGRSALHWACKCGHADAVRLLVSRGLDPCKVDARGSSCLMLAARSGHSKLCKLLLTGRASKLEHINLHDNRGWTALMGAARNSQLLCAKYLILAGADINASDRDGRTSLLLTKDAAMARLLLNHGADICAEIAYTRHNVLHTPAETGNVELLEVLIEHACKKLKAKELRHLITSTETNQGCSAIQLAQRNGHANAVSKLRSASFFMYSAQV